VVGVGRSAKNSYSKGTIMKKSNQSLPVDATTSAFPGHVSVAMAEIAENVQEGLLALAVGAGLQVNGRGRQAVPPGQRSPAPAVTAGRP
jgi:hypothetical protein